MFRRRRFNVVIFILTLQLLTSKASQPECRTTSKCDCIRNSGSGGYEYQCPPSSFGSKTIIHVFPNTNKLTIYCNNTNILNEEFLPIGNFPKLTNLYMEGCPMPLNGFQEVMQSFNLTNLKLLSFKGQPLTNQSLKPDHFNGLTSLNSLELIRNNLESLDTAIFNKMPQLTDVILDRNRIEMKTDIFVKLPNLQTLSMYDNGLEKIPKNAFAGSDNLNWLDLRNNQLKILQNESFNNLQNLKILELSINKITTIEDDSLASLTNLTQISLRRNKLTNFSRKILENCTVLELIRLDENPNLNLLDDVFSNFRYLTEVNLGFNRLKTLSENLFFGSVSLKNLYINDNNLEELPKGLFKGLRNLNKLHLNNNRLKSINGEVFSSLLKLEILNLQNNELEYLDEFSLKNLINLKEINLSFNKINKIHPQSLNGNKNLVKFLMSHNRFDFENSKNLEKSYLDYCLDIKEVDLSYNNISRYPYSLNSLIEIQEINLEFNSIKKLEMENLLYVSYNRDLLKINLENNKIAIVDFITNLEEIEKSISKISLSLSHNPIICDCHIFHLAKYIQDGGATFDNNHHLLFKHEELTCSNKFALDEIPLEQLTCSLMNSNLTKPSGICEFVFRPSDRTIVVECSGRGLEEVPELNLDLIEEIYDFVETEVHLENNRLKRCPGEDFGYENVTRLYLEGNLIENVTYLPGNLKVLNLKDNNLENMDAVSMKILNSSSASQIFLGTNPWFCGCSMKNFSIYLRENSLKVVDALEVLCSNLNSSRLLNLNENDLCESKSSRIWMTLLILMITISVCIACLSSCLYYKYQEPILIWLYSRGLCLWLAKEEEIDKNMIFDAFVSFSHTDEQFVTENIVSVLESGENPYKLCVHVRDWIGGERIQTQIFNSVRDSRRTIVVLSQSFLQSDWGMLEFRTAHSKAMQEGRSRVIIIIYGDVDMETLDEQLNDYLKTNTYIKWGDPWFFNKLRYALPKNRKMRNDLSRKHTNMMQFIDDKFSLVNFKRPISETNTTPPILMDHHQVDFEERNLTSVVA